MSKKKDIKIVAKLFYVEPNWGDPGQVMEATTPQEAVELVIKEHGYELESDDSFEVFEMVHRAKFKVASAKYQLIKV